MSELDALDPIPESVVLRSGTVAVLEELRARQFFKLLRIVTHGAMPAMVDQSLFSINAADDPQEFTARLLSLIVFSIPDAEDEAIQFVRSMCRPHGLADARRPNKLDTERNNALWAALDAQLENPDLDDLVTIIEAIVKRESADIQALGKRLVAMFKLAEKTGQTDRQNLQTSATAIEDFSEGSPESSTSSPVNTGGRTASSRTSASSDSVNA